MVIRGINNVNTKYINWHTSELYYHCGPLF